MVPAFTSWPPCWDQLHVTWLSLPCASLFASVQWRQCSCSKFMLRQDPLEAILVIFGRRALIFCLKALGKKWKMTPLWCARALEITWETQKCRKRAPRSVEFNFFINCDKHRRFLQNERRRIDLPNLASDFSIFAWGLSYDLSKFSDDFTPLFPLWKPITKSLDKN